MSRQRLIGLLLLVVGSLVIGFVTGNWFYALYVDSIPEALKASTSLAGTRFVFLFHGLGLGVAITVWSLVAVAAAHFFRPRPPSER